MRKIAPLALLAGAALATPAWAQTYKIDHILINGLKSVTDDQVRPALKEKPGDTTTVDQIKADQDLLVSALEKLNVTGGVKTSIAAQGNHIDIIFAVDDNGIQKPTVTTVAPKLKDEVFTGNVAVDSATLLAASGLKPGDDLSNDKIAAAQKAIAQAYKDAKAAVDVNISGTNVRNPDGSYTVNWTIVETKKKKKKVDIDDDGGTHTE